MGAILNANNPIYKIGNIAKAIIDDRILKTNIGKKLNVMSDYYSILSTGTGAENARLNAITNTDRFKSLFMNSNGAYSTSRIAKTGAVAGAIGYEMLADDTSIAGLGASAGAAGAAGYGIAKFLL